MKGVRRLTFKELYRYKDLRQEIATIERELMAITQLSAIDYTKARVNSGHTGDPTADMAARREKLVDKLNGKKEECVKQIDRVERFIESIPDETVQALFREHFILLMTYEEIGRAHHYDRTTVSKKIRAYVTNIPQFP